MVKAYWAVFIALTAGTVMAEEFPMEGTIHAMHAVGELQYRCQKIGETLACDFNKTWISRKESRASSAELRVAAGEEYRSSGGAEWVMKECAKHQTTVSTLRANADDGDTSPLERRDLLALADAFEDACRFRSEESHYRLVDVQNDKASRTCIVHASHFSEVFRRVRDKASGAYTWEHVEPAHGSCGLVERSQLLPAGEDPIAGWKYVLELSATRRDAMLGTIACKDVDGQRYVWSQEGKDRLLNCDYVQFQRGK